MPQMGLTLWVPHLIRAIFQTLTLADKENGTSHYLGLNPEICRQVIHAWFGFGEILAWVSLLGFAVAEWGFFYSILSKLWCLLFHRRKPINAGEISIALTRQAAHNELG